MGNEKFKRIFDNIHAEEDLKRKTTAFLQEKIQRNNNRSSVRYARLRLAVAYCSFALVFISGAISYTLYTKASAYIDIDTNPSIGLVVNRFNRVIKAESYGEDSAILLEGMSVFNAPYERVINNLMDVMEQRGYFHQDGILSITIQTNDQDREGMMLSNLQSLVENPLRELSDNQITNVFPVSEDVKIHANANHITPAKYLAILELQKVDPTANIEQCKSHSIGEINRMIKVHGGHYDNSAPIESIGPATPEEAEPEEVPPKVHGGRKHSSGHH